MAAYAVIFAAEVCAHGRTDVETVIFSSDNCLLASMGFDIKETGTETGYQIGAGVFQALAKEKDLQRSAYCILPLATFFLSTLSGSQLWNAMHDLVLGLQCEDSGELDSTTLSDPW